MDVAEDGEVLALQVVLEAANMTGGVLPPVADEESGTAHRRLRTAAVRASTYPGLSVVLVDLNN
jgi:hypothetical protein